MKFNIKLVY